MSQYEKGVKQMNKEEKAKIILESLDEYMQVNWHLEEYYMKAIVKGLNKIDKQERESEEK
jgi:hypothetical protein